MQVKLKTRLCKFLGGMGGGGQTVSLGDVQIGKLNVPRNFVMFRGSPK